MVLTSSGSNGSENCGKGVSRNSKGFPIESFGNGSYCSLPVIWRWRLAWPGTRQGTQTESGLWSKGAHWSSFSDNLQNSSFHKLRTYNPIVFIQIVKQLQC